MATGLRRTLLWVITARAALITIVLGSAILVQVKAPGSVAVDPFFALIGLTYALTVVYAVTLAQAERHAWLVDLQFAVDAFVISSIVHLTGGITSYFSSLYVLPVIAASATQYIRGGITVAVFSALMFGGLVVSQYASPFGPIVPWSVDPEAILPPLRLALFTLGLNMFGFFAVAILGGYLAESARRADVRLKQASTRIADLEAFNAHVIESLTSGLLTMDARGRVMSFNRAAELISRIAAADAIGADAGELLQMPAEWRAALARGLDEGRLLRAEYGFETRDGRHIEVGASMAVLVGPGGPAGYLFTFQDVTDMKKREREARVQQRLAAVGEMAAGIAHEIRNPLASMSGSIQVLRDELTLSAEQEQLMDIVLRESERLNDTIKNFLAYARPQRTTLQRIDLRTLVDETAVLLRNSSEHREQHRIVVDVPPEEVPFLGDESQLRQVVWNLATNGLRAMPHGGTLTLSVASDPHDAAHVPMAVLRVRDEGIGIPPEEIDRVFQPFRGAFARGSGLGLSIVHRIVTDYAGRIDVASAPGAGTRVEVRLPGRGVEVVNV
ncbi:MAG: PAS domain-containing protein [Acidobacteria bacterium]|nr:PAS domain-containing protein [Acidobacteriota bacterium]